MHVGGMWYKQGTVVILCNANSLSVLVLCRMCVSYCSLSCTRNHEAF